MKIALSRDRRLMLIDGRKFARPLGTRSSGCASCGLRDVWVRLDAGNQGILCRAYCSDCARNPCRDGRWKEAT